MKIAVCDEGAIEPLRRLVNGPIETMDQLWSAERLIRTVVLHDDIAAMPTPRKYDGGENPLKRVIRGYHWRGEPDPSAFPPITDPRWVPAEFIIAPYSDWPKVGDLKFFWPMPEKKQDLDELLSVSRINPSASLVELASTYANAAPETEGEIYFRGHIEYLQSLLGVVHQGGSALLTNEFGRKALDIAAHCPEDLLAGLDQQWTLIAQELKSKGLALSIPPVLGIVLSRCASRASIPAVVADLRVEWHDARRKAWLSLDELRASKTVAEALQAMHAIEDAHKAFSPVRTDFDTRPVRILWDLVAAGLAGASISTLAGGSPKIGALTGIVAHAARSLPSFTQDHCGPLFRRGAFDLASRVRRALSEIELGALQRLFSAAELRALGFS